MPYWVRPEPPALKPGVIPLRPLDLSSLYNGAIAAIRANPKTTIGLTAIMVIVSQLLIFGIQAAPATAVLTGAANFDRNTDDSFGAAFGLGYIGGQMIGAVVTSLVTIILSGMLTVTIGRSVFGERTTIKEAWQRAKPRIWALLGVALVELVLFAVVLGFGVAIVAGLALTVGPLGAIPVGLLLALGYFAFYLYLIPVFSLVPSVLILEHQSVFGAVGRSVSLVRKGFWRLLGILLLTSVIVGLVTTIIGMPFVLVGEVAAFAGGDTHNLGPKMLIIFAMAAIGAVIAQVISLPFKAAVNVLLYTDQRMRTEALDLVLQTEARTRERLGQPGIDADSLWLPTRPPVQV
ncbi:hypothetical protein AWB85_11920 [Mycobacteroides immunogenum]|uniref:DUF7847 domain-containing protein n=1 Tax=Mycobacteroides immunogenum TaxID=83262 RepID=A0A179VAC0_9MYCO|nr:hypothetical protein [Mycobacteroides immunogenum]OAT67915.1 hypothetical protein AWB85_11920 [Mycobacteroides immunogenum]